jgi:hypothetical protein
MHKSPDAPLQYDFNLSKSIRIPGAHGEEIVRDLITDVHVSFLSATPLLTDADGGIDTHNIHLWRRRACARVETCGRRGHGG